MVTIISLDVPEENIDHTTNVSAEQYRNLIRIIFWAELRCKKSNFYLW